MDQSAHRHPVCLVDPSHEFYRTWIRAQNLGRRFHRATDPVAASYNRKLAKWESALRRLLSAGVQFSSQRYLAHHCEPRSRGSIAIRHCREIDLVLGTPDQPKLFSEFKLRETSDPAKERGMSQMNKGLELARLRWPDLSGLLINVAMGKVLETEDAYHPDAVLVDVSQAREALATLPPCATSSLWLDGTDLAKEAVSNGFLTEDDIVELSTARRHTINPFSRLKEMGAQSAAPSLGSTIADAFRVASLSGHADALSLHV